MVGVVAPAALPRAVPVLVAVETPEEEETPELLAVAN
jgi:hypothetical protein